MKAGLYILCALAATSLQGGAAMRKQASGTDDVAMAETEAKGDCAESAVEDICICDAWSSKVMMSSGRQCSGCKDNKKWGYGCDVPCPEDCKDGCDFSGNCILIQSCPANCKRNSRVDEPTGKDECLNAHGECQACNTGYFGHMCDKKCPSKCSKGKSVEGECTRGGKCYSCEKGYYGEECEKRCPLICPECMMKDGYSEKVKDLWLTAGSCEEARCKTGNFWGDTCNEPCPENCGGSKTPNCERADGKCFKCKKDKFWGPKCEQECSPGCVGGHCEQEDGTCISHCKTGTWGRMCDRDCPDHTGPEGCEREDGFPVTCLEGFYPFRAKELDKEGKTIVMGVCRSCPDECTDGLCDIDGKCTKGCVEGKYGESCEKDCSKGCDGPCDQANGQCAACKPGLTGAKCDEKCHSQCATCNQFASSLVFTSAGNGKKDCLSCHAMEPAELVGTSCECIVGSERPGSNEQCKCSKPDDDSKRAVFLVDPKRCGEECNETPGGDKMRLVMSHEKKTSKCIPVWLYKSVIRNEGNMEQGDCEDGYLEVPVKDGKAECLLKDYADFVNMEFGA